MKGKRSLLKKIGEAATGIFLSAVMTLYLPVMALAYDWDIAEGDITVERTSDTEQQVSQGSRSENDNNPTITGSSSEHTVTIDAAPNMTATVTFQDLNIDVSGTGSFSTETQGDIAVNTTGAGNVIINLDGENTVASGAFCAGIQKENTGSLTITGTDGTNTDSLSATGGHSGAGIGGGLNGNGADIEIGGITTVIAVAGVCGAGIGGGSNGSGSDITITDHATVTAKCIDEGAGIGGGLNGNGSNITINGEANVTAEGGICGAGIGGGDRGDGLGITISGESTVSATGGINGAGIGGGSYGNSSDITISGEANVTAQGGETGAGIGGGYSGAGSYIEISEDADVIAEGGECGAGIGGGLYGNGSNINIGGNSTVIAVGGDGGAGIGSGQSGDGSNISIVGNSTVIAVGGDGGAGIGSGALGGTASDISVSGSADVSAAGGDNNTFGGAGAAIGSGVTTRGEDGTPVDPDTTDFYDTGSIKTYEPGTTAEEITEETVDPVQKTTGTVPEPDPDPNPQARPAAIVPSDSEAVSGGNAQTAPVSEAFSLSAVLDAKIETFLQQLAALLASGRPDLIRALMKSGFSVDLGNFTMLNAKTCALLAQVADAGIPVKADYTYGGVNYRVTIPAGEGASVNALASDGVCTVEELMSAFETQTR